MDKTSKNQTLEQRHRNLFKENEEYLSPEYDTLEQPYAGEVVETVTTYWGGFNETVLEE